MNAYDGNGNVIGYVDLATGAQSATYEYGAFGETLLADGVVAEAMPFRFSTKYADTETGLLYYGLRYYSSGTGRWINRDPLEEGGGANLSAFVLNDPVSLIDVLGRDPVSAATAAVVAVTTSGGSSVAWGGGVSASTALANAGISAPAAGGITGLATAAAATGFVSGGVVGTVATSGTVMMGLPFTVSGGHYPARIPQRPATAMGGWEEGDTLNAMRLQLQIGTKNLWSDVYVAPSKFGVSTRQVRDGLASMYSAAGGLSTFPASCTGKLKSAAISMSQKIGRFPPSGVAIGGNVARETFECSCNTYRIDLENLRGHNLRY